jgi:hypothetical protein
MHEKVVPGTKVLPQYLHFITFTLTQTCLFDGLLEQWPVSAGLGFSSEERWVLQCLQT